MHTRTDTRTAVRTYGCAAVRVYVYAPARSACTSRLCAYGIACLRVNIGYAYFEVMRQRRRLRMMCLRMRMHAQVPR